MAHRWSGAPLVSATLMAHQLMVRHYYIVVAHHMSGAPLVAISSIALFLVVYSPTFSTFTQYMSVSHGYSTIGGIEWWLWRRQKG